MLCVLEDCLRLRVRPLAAPLGGGELAHDPAPDVEVGRLLLAGRVGVRELRDLDQARLDCVRKAEVTDYPREDAVRVLPCASEIVRRRGKIDAEVDSPMLVYAIEAVDPY